MFSLSKIYLTGGGGGGERGMLRTCLDSRVGQ